MRQTNTQAIGKILEQQVNSIKKSADTALLTCTKFNNTLDEILAARGIKKVGGMVTLNPSAKRK